MATRYLTLYENLSADLTQLTAGDYRYAERRPDGAVVVVGANGSGAEIAEDLHLAGRRVHLFTSPCGAPVRSKGLSGRGTGARIDVGGLVRQGLRLYGALLDIQGVRMVAVPGLYLGCRATQLDLSEAGVTSVIWNSAAGEEGEQITAAA